MQTYGDRQFPGEHVAKAEHQAGEDNVAAGTEGRVVQALGGVLELVAPEDRLLVEADAQECGGGDEHGDGERSAGPVGLESACYRDPTKPKLDEEDRRHEQRAEGHPEEQVEPPSGTETEPERRERSSVEEASRKPHRQDGCHEAGYSTYER